MRAIVAHAPHDLRLDEREAAGDPGPGEVRLRLAVGGICGSDLHYYHNGGFGTVRLREPMILGHEVSGTVEALGKGVSKLAIGDIGALNPSRACGHCEECRRGLPNQCLDMVFNGSAMRFPHVQGLFRETLTVPEAQLIKAEGVADASLLALAEPFAVCLHAARRAGDLFGRTVVVFGCGPIGCLAVAAAKLAGAAKIVACDVHDAPLKIAEALGADRLVNTAANPGDLDDLKAGKGRTDCVFECSGHPGALAAALEILRPRGRLVTVGLGGAIEVPMSLVVTKEIEAVGSFRFDEEFAVAVNLIASGRADLSPLVTHRMPAARAIEAFDLASDRSQAMKIHLDLQDWDG
ncbi:L-idonate 5-dehydrogenase [Jiella pacifica]|uniref:Alcohol dehydrogenase catalytic domain-containing protein n=1 Tax=Jiella pacifica TaxID=2696469 RepID=A0A6N9T9U0_9HYPH|nr:L-idonate 5-dehydrogenase [Jiella pacifica]MAU95514.1 L-idonate 5-dehydrogenase [Fulvimarina sp.]NDW06826.1 alcohol dehydrogenase catalytic domain-containing protein [Jiella pacifica]